MVNSFLYKNKPYITPDTNAFMVKPGIYAPGWTIIHPRTSPNAPAIPPAKGPNIIEAIATGIKVKLKRRVGVM